MGRIYIGVGSNITPEVHIPKAIDLLTAHVVSLRSSNWYLTMPLRSSSGSKFVNGVLSAELPTHTGSTLDDTSAPDELRLIEMILETKAVLRRIESDLGRVRTADSHAPRTIDLDILLFGDLQISSERLTIPDPDILHREFLSVPLRELDPGLIIPGLCIPISQIAPRRHTMRLLPLFSRAVQLRCEERKRPVRSLDSAYHTEQLAPTGEELYEELYGH